MKYARLNIVLLLKPSLTSRPQSKRSAVLPSPYLAVNLGPVHTMPDKFEIATLRAKTEQMFCVHTRAFYVVVYFQNFKISYSSPCWLLGKINYMTKWRQRTRKVADTKSSPSTLIQKSIVFKLFHSGERFQKDPFSWIFLCVLVWTEAVSVTIKLRFQIYPA